MAFEAWKARAEDLQTELYALFLAARDPRTPLLAKGLVALVVAYAVSPLDPIPDFLPVVGFLDELVVLPLGIALALRLVPESVLAECRERAEDDLDVGRLRWVVAAVVLAVWLAVGFAAVWAFTNWV